MRIGIDAYPLAGTPNTGIGMYLYNLFNNLNSIDKENEYFIYSFADIPLPFINDRWHIRSIKIPGFMQRCSTLWLFQNWRKILYRDKIDVYFGSQNFLPLFMPRRIKKILVVNDLASFSCPQTFFFLSFISARILFTRSLSIADKVITISKATKKELKKYFPYFNEDKISLIYDAVQGDFFKPGNRAYAHEYIHKKFFVADRYILCVTALEWRKNVTGLLKAFHLFKNKFNTGHKLLIAGGEKRVKAGEIFRIFKKLFLEGEVCFLGYVDSEDLRNLYQGADLFVFPSLFEGFGFPPLEAMASGTPVVASDIPVFKEVLGDAAILVDPHDKGILADAIHNVLNNAALRERLIEKGLERVKLYSWEETARKTLAIIRSI